VCAGEVGAVLTVLQEPVLVFDEDLADPPARLAGDGLEDVLVKAGVVLPAP